MKNMGRIAKWRQLSETEFEQLVKESRSFQDLARKIGYEKTGGGTQTALKQAVKERQLDTSHFLGQGWNKENYDYTSFEKNSLKKGGKTTLNPLIKLRGRQCECCKNTEWLSQPINLEIHHKNGDRSDNSLENLQLLCPNCHSYTETFCYKTKYEIIPEERYVEVLKDSKSIHQALITLGLTAAAGNYARARNLIEKYNITHLMSDKSTQEHQSEKSSE